MGVVVLYGYTVNVIIFSKFSAMAKSFNLIDSRISVHSRKATPSILDTLSTNSQNEDLYYSLRKEYKVRNKCDDSLRGNLFNGITEIRHSAGADYDDSMEYFMITFWVFVVSVILSYLFQSWPGIHDKK